MNSSTKARIANSPRGKRNAVLKIVSVVITSVLITAFVGEVVVEHVLRRHDMVKEEPPFYKWSFYTSSGQRISAKTGLLRLMLHPGVGYTNFPGQKTEFFTINQHGFRGADVNYQRKTKPRIVLIGGSTAFGFGVKNDDATFSNHLEQLLGDVQVINAAVIGHRSGDELAYLTLKLLDLNPDIVIALDGFNDFAQRVRRRWIAYNGFLQIEEELEKGSKVLSDQFFVRIANLYRILFARTIHAVQVAKRRASVLFGRPIREDFLRVGLDEAITSYTGNMDKMKRFANAYSAQFLCVIQTTGRLIENGQDGLYSEFRSRAKTIMSKQDIQFIDLNDHADRFREDMYIDNLHINDGGNQVMAAIVAKYLSEKNLGIGSESQKGWGGSEGNGVDSM